MKSPILLLLFALTFFSATGQTKSDIFTQTPVTWLGLDFTQLKFIGSANQFKGEGAVTNEVMRDKYFKGWNQLFITEQKKYNIASAVNRSSVTYAIEITEAANSHSTANYFTDNPTDDQLLTKKKIADLIGNYDFQGKTGLGLLFFVEYMDKNQAEASIWVTFVNMETKTVLLTKQETGKAGGFGFRNYWAKSFYNVLSDINYLCSSNKRL